MDRSLSNATANIAWNGGLFSSCSNNDVNQAYLSFISGDNIAIEVGLNAVNGQVEVEMNVSMVSGFEIKFFSTDIFYEDHFIDVQEDLNLKYIIDFETNFVYRYINGNLENSSPIQANFNSLENIAFSNSFGNFKLGCISVSDVTDLDNDGYYANEDCDDTNPQTNPGQQKYPMMVWITIVIPILQTMISMEMVMLWLLTAMTTMPASTRGCRNSIQRIR